MKNKIKDVYETYNALICDNIFRKHKIYNAEHELKRCIKARVNEIQGKNYDCEVVTLTPADKDVKDEYLESNAFPLLNSSFKYKPQTIVKGNFSSYIDGYIRRTNEFGQIEEGIVFIDAVDLSHLSVEEYDDIISEQANLNLSGKFSDLLVRQLMLKLYVTDCQFVEYIRIVRFPTAKKRIEDGEFCNTSFQCFETNQHDLKKFTLALITLNYEVNQIVKQLIEK